MTRRAPAHAPAVARVDIDDDVLLYDGVDLHWLTGTASVIYRAINGVLTSEEIAAALMIQFSTEDARIRDDTESALAKLRAMGLIVFVDPALGPSYKVSEHVAFTHDDDLVALANLRTGRRQILEGAGVQAWDLLVQLGSPDAVVAVLEAQYPEATTVRGDVIALVDELEHAGLLEPITTPDAGDDGAWSAST